MKNIYLIGDSIRYGAPPDSPGYGVYVKEKLKGKADVFYPEENCRFAQYTLRHLSDWSQTLDTDRIDVVHWNNGLWDVLRLYGDDPLTPLDFYINLLERIYKRIKTLFKNARVIFATTTTVIDELMEPHFAIYNADIGTYNAAAVELMKKLNVEVDDLYTVAVAHDLKKMHSDQIHFNETGSEILADAVIKSLDI